MCEQLSPQCIVSRYRINTHSSVVHFSTLHQKEGCQIQLRCSEVLSSAKMKCFVPRKVSMPFVTPVQWLIPTTRIPFSTHASWQMASTNSTILFLCIERFPWKPGTLASIWYWTGDAAGLLPAWAWDKRRGLMFLDKSRRYLAVIMKKSVQ